MTREYDRNECYSCAMRRKRLEGAQEPEHIAVPPAQFNSKTVPAKKEAAVPEKMEPKERVFAVIQKFGACVSTPILQRVPTVNAEQLREIVKELEEEKKIVIAQDGRKTVYAIPGAAISSPAKKSSATPPIKSRAKAERTVAAPRSAGGNGAFAAVITELEARRTAALDQVARFDTALEQLRALA